MHREDVLVSTGDPVGLIHESDDTVALVEADDAGKQITARSPLQLFWRRLRRDKVAIAALGFIVVLVLVAFLAPVQRRYHELAADPERLAAILAAGADKARAIARVTLAEVRERMGFLIGH